MFYILDINVDEKAGATPVIEYNFKKQQGEMEEPALSTTERPTEGITLPFFRLVENATLNDVLSGFEISSSRGLFVNQKFREIVLSLQMGQVYFHPLNLESASGQTIDDYYYMQVVQQNALVDYGNSLFKIVKLLKEIGELKVSSGQEFVLKSRDLIKERKKLKPKQIQLNTGDEVMDLFFLKNSGLPDFILTERGKSVLANAGISGISFKPIPEIIA